MNKSLLPLSLLTLLPLQGAERLLLAAENQVIEVDRAGRVTAVLKHPGHSAIWDAWRLPDGGIAYVHKLGLAVFDANRKLVLEHASIPGKLGVQSSGLAVLQQGQRFALLDSGAGEIRVVDREGRLISRTPIPDLGSDPLFSRYRMLRESRRKGAFWLVQYDRNTLLEVETGTGRILSTVPLAPHLNPNPPATHHAFASLTPGDGSLYATTATGLQILHLDAKQNRLASWTAADLGIATRYLLGMQKLANGNIMMALGDYHLKSASEGRDLLAEVTPKGKVVWKLTRDRLVDQIEGFVDPKSGLEEMRITNVHVYDNNKLAECLRVKR